MIDLSRDGDIHVVTLCNGPNMIDPTWQKRMLEVLDAVEANCEGNAGLVLAGEGKFFSNGLNVEVVMGLEGEEMAGSLASKQRCIFKTLKRTLYAEVAAGLGVGKAR